MKKNTDERIESIAEKMTSRIGCEGCPLKHYGMLCRVFDCDTTDVDDMANNLRWLFDEAKMFVDNVENEVVEDK